MLLTTVYKTAKLLGSNLSLKWEALDLIRRGLFSFTSVSPPHYPTALRIRRATVETWTTVQASQTCLIIAPQGGITGMRSNTPAEKCQMPCSIPFRVLGFRAFSWKLQKGRSPSGNG
jgi:hypothetical protein